MQIVHRVFKMPVLSNYIKYVFFGEGNATTRASRMSETRLLDVKYVHYIEIQHRKKSNFLTHFNYQNRTISTPGSGTKDFKGATSMAGIFFISNFRCVLNAVCFLLGNSPASEFYMPTFRNTLSVPSS